MRSAAPGWVNACRPLILTLTEQFAALAAGVSDAGWNAASSCAGWSVAELVAHLAFGANYYSRAVTDALDAAPRALWSGGGDVAHAQQRTFMRATPADGVAMLREASRHLDAAFARVAAADMTLNAWHMRGPRPIWMYVAMRLYELALHDWDLQKSLRPDPTLARDVALPLVDLMLAAILPATLDTVAAHAVRADVAFVFGDDQPMRCVRIEDGALRATAPGGTEPHVTLALEPEAFVLGMTGRLAWPVGARITGDADLADNFAALFRVW